DAQMVAIWNEGNHSFSNIAVSLDLKPRTVRERLTELGIYHPRKPITKKEKREMIARYNGGESARAIAKDMKYSTASVAKVLRDAGFETDPTKRKRLKEGGYAMR